MSNDGPRANSIKKYINTYEMGREQYNSLKEPVIPT